MKRFTLAVYAFILFNLFLTSNLNAAQYDIKTMTPEIEAAVSNRQARYSQLQQVKDQGAIGETNKGYVHVLNSLPGASELVQAENSDRRVIYQAIAVQNNLGSNGLGIVESVFAEVLQEKSTPGQMIQSKDGAWVKK